MPEPAAAVREAAELNNGARLDVPSTAICTGFTSDQYKAALESSQVWLAGFAELRNLNWVDLPTSHWPMWSRPRELAAIIGGLAEWHGRDE